MCVAGGIIANFEPHKVVFVPCLFMVLFVPMVLIPVNRKRQEEQADHAFRNESDV
jgi:hypothetical protein